MAKNNTPEIRFYHLEHQTLEQALPALINKIYASGHKIVIKCPDQETLENIDSLLWTYRPESFLPHGSPKTGHASEQPVWLTTEDDNPNEASVLVVTGGVSYAGDKNFSIICDVFEGRHKESLKAARSRWSDLKEQGCNLTYWQQKDKGWEHTV